MKKLINLKKNFDSFGYFIVKNFFNDNQIKKITEEINNAKKTKKYYDRKNNLIRIEKIYNKRKNLRSANKKIEKYLSLVLKKKFIIFKDKFNSKPPNGEGYDAHFDGVFKFKGKSKLLKKGWYVYGKEFVNVLVALDNTEKNNGPLEISKAIDKNFDYLFELTKKDGTPNIKKKVEKNLTFKKILCKRGDILIFKNNCPHRSKKNSSNKKRRILYYTYSLKSNGSKYKSYFKDKEKSKNKTSKSLTGEI